MHKRKKYDAISLKKLTMQGTEKAEFLLGLKEDRKTVPIQTGKSKKKKQRVRVLIKHGRRQ